jgi:uncharacterized protein YjeT (DUF2065 family)
MSFNFSLFFLALGLAFAMESILWILAPAKMRDTLHVLLSLADGQLRSWGIVLLVIGLALCGVGRFLLKGYL